MSRETTHPLRILSRLVVILVVLLQFLVFSPPQPAEAAVVFGFSKYYIPGFSDDLMATLEDIEISNDNNAPYNNGIGDRLTNIITISAGGNLTLYYDHWEGGYSTGAAGDETFSLTKGQVITFRTTNLPEPRGTSSTCTGSTYQIVGSTAVTTDNCYDGRDRLYVAGGAVSVAQAYWPTSTDTNYANAWEIYPIKPYQTHYTVPVGEDMYGPTYWDRFGAQSYSNTDGVTDWSGTPWVESGTGTDTSATGGIIWVTTGGKLRFEGY
ncbi:MAG: hypothetical protein JXA14_14805, partial [Anaerolineae bacterium]|nr:hypothetical protein [Anaerolineae bacterium]